jgi:hypothetical protein
VGKGVLIEFESLSRATNANARFEVTAKDERGSMAFSGLVLHFSKSSKNRRRIRDQPGDRGFSPWHAYCRASALLVWFPILFEATNKTFAAQGYKCKVTSMLVA